MSRRPDDNLLVKCIDHSWRKVQPLSLYSVWILRDDKLIVGTVCLGVQVHDIEAPAAAFRGRARLVTYL